MNNQILDDELETNEVTSTNVQYAGFRIRIGASLIDMFILLPIYLLNTYNLLNFKSLPMMLILTSLVVIYKPYLEWKKSATYGKIAVGIKLIDKNLNNISGEQAIKRYFPWAISFLISTTTNILMFASPEFQNVDQFMELGLLISASPIKSITTNYSFIFIILIGSLIFNSKKQGFHDKYAKTYCIKTK